jgi:hypothetical protein
VDHGSWTLRITLQGILWRRYRSDLRSQHSFALLSRCNGRCCEKELAVLVKVLDDHAGGRLYAHTVTHQQWSTGEKRPRCTNTSARDVRWTPWRMRPWSGRPWSCCRSETSATWPGCCSCWPWSRRGHARRQFLAAPTVDAQSQCEAVSTRHSGGGITTHRGAEHRGPRRCTRHSGRGPPGTPTPVAHHDTAINNGATYRQTALRQHVRTLYFSSRGFSWLTSTVVGPCSHTLHTG